MFHDFARTENISGGYVRRTPSRAKLALLSSIQKFVEIQGWLLLTFSICLHDQSSSFTSIIVEMSENVIHQIDSENEWLLLFITFTVKFDLVLVLALENSFSWSFHFKANRKSIDSSKKRY